MNIFSFFAGISAFLCSIVAGDSIISEFKISFSDEKVNDMNRRIREARLPASPARKGVKNELGIELNDVRTLLDHWQNKFDWREKEAQLNRIPQFVTNIDGIDLHFLHVKANTAGFRNYTVCPILMAHGWPSTSFDFHEIIPLLTNGPKDSEEGERVILFDVVVPSLPGFPLSSSPIEPRFGVKEAALLYTKLMRRLEYKKYLAHGGDWGSMIVPAMAIIEESYDDNKKANIEQGDNQPQESNRLLGIHINGFITTPPIVWNPLTTAQSVASLLFPSMVLDYWDQAKVQLQRGVLTEFGYFLEQATKPVTLGIALHNSPVAILAWLCEKYISWSDSSPPLPHSSAAKSSHAKDGSVGVVVTPAERLAHQLNFSRHSLKHSRITIDEMLTSVSLYWLTDSITSSLMMYHNSVDFNDLMSDLMNIKLRTTPAAIADFPVDIIWSPLSWTKHNIWNIIQYNRFDKGGHFPALEQPDLLAADLREFHAKIGIHHLVQTHEEL